MEGAEEGNVAKWTTRRGSTSRQSHIKNGTVSSICRRYVSSGRDNLSRMRNIVFLVVSIATLLALSCRNTAPDLTDNVKEYMKRVPKADQKQAALVAAGLMYYARKSTLTYSGNVVFGNWILGNSTGACISTGTASLLLSNIDHFDDLGKCPDGDTITRATEK
jgi:hypothetical protein